MEPISMLAAGAATLFATKMVEEAGSYTGRSLSAAAAQLVGWLRDKGHQDVETSAAITMVQAAPTDQARIDLLTQVLATRATADPAFADRLQELVSSAQQAGDVRLTIGGAHIHGSVTGGQVTQIAGNHHQMPSDHG